MRKLGKFLTMVLVAMAVLTNAYAQDLSEATEIYNNAATALNENRDSEALTGFQKALSLAEAAGEAGTQMVSDCKGIIPKLLIKIGKEAANAKNLDGALANLKDAVAKATEYGDAETAKEAKELIPLILITDGNSLLNEKKYAEAIIEYEKAIAEDPENGMAYLRIGMCKSQLGDADAAVAAFEKAAAFGQEANAKKQLMNVYVKKMVATYKAKNNAATLENAVKALEYGENPNAYKIGGMAAVALKKYDQGIELLEKAAADASVNYNLARAYEAKANNAKACEYYKLITADKNYGAYATAKVAALCK